MHKPKSRRVTLARHRRGSAVVEFAVIAPLFFLLLAGIVEFGQAFRIEHMLSTASRRGARYAVVKGSTTSQVQQMVITQVVESLGVKEADVTVTIGVNGNAGTDLSQAEKGDEISVVVSVPFTKAGVGFYANMLSHSTLTSACVFEHE